MKQLGQTAVILIIVALVVGFLAGWAVARRAGVGSYATSTPTGTSSTSTPNNVNPFTQFGTTTTTGISTQTGNTGSASGTFRGTPDLVVEGVGSVSVENQKAGMTVSVARVELPATGWVAIREEGTAKVSGWILGAKRLPAGTHTNVTVELLRGTAANKTYYATIYRDNGDGKFEKATDSLLSSNGNLIIDTFTTN